jgi:hypothetical protein
MTEVIDSQGRWILTHELCEACGCPSWDAFPAGVVADRWTCQRCGHEHRPHIDVARERKSAHEGWAIVGQIIDIRPHPNADRLEVIRIEIGFPIVELVSGKHYREGDVGVWIRPGAVIPGWLARQLWLPVVDGHFNVREIEMAGVPSPGVWAGEWYRNDKARPSKLNSKARAQGADREQDGWLHWGPFAPEWVVGDIVDQGLGIVPAPLAQLEDA